MKKLTIDSSVIVASLLETETRHSEALQIWEAVLTGKDVAILPYSVLVEIAAAIRRRTGSEELAYEVKSELLKIENVSFVVLDQKAAEEAAELAIRTGLKGMDALVIQVALEFDTELITFDDEMTKRYQTVQPALRP
ncbi:MAG: type II toxin-antitoxin system VapC family toxin [Deltaproteobacteria bacterium]|nr:type II toxin-antitoxin system VapC family toxin [Deltaproteobacteria bacterium]